MPVLHDLNTNANVVSLGRRGRRQNSLSVLHCSQRLLHAGTNVNNSTQSGLLSTTACTSGSTASRVSVLPMVFRACIAAAGSNGGQVCLRRCAPRPYVLRRSHSVLHLDASVLRQTAAHLYWQKATSHAWECDLTIV